MGGGATVDKADKNGLTPLLCVADKNHTEIIRLLLGGGATVDKADNVGLTPLLCAADKKHIEVIRLLLGGGATVDKADNVGLTPLHCAARQNYIEGIRLLLEGGATVDKADKDGASPLWIAAAKNHVDAVRLLSEKGADTNCLPFDKEKYAFPLYYAAKLNHPEVCELLVSFGANTEMKFRGETALQIATQKKNTKIIKILQAATDQKREEKRKVIIANVAKAKIEQGKGEKVREDAAKMCQDLWNYAESGKLAAFQMTDKVFDINWADKNGDTFLIIASDKGRANVVTFLLAKDALVD